MKKEGRKHADITGHCLHRDHYRLNDFTGNIFHRLLDAPKGIREEILEETKRRKKSYFRREIEEVQAILKTTDREELFPLLCTASLLLFAAGAAIAVMIGNVFLIPVLACGFLFQDRVCRFCVKNPPHRSRP